MRERLFSESSERGWRGESESVESERVVENMDWLRWHELAERVSWPEIRVSDLFVNELVLLAVSHDFECSVFEFLVMNASRPNTGNADAFFLHSNVDAKLMNPNSDMKWERHTEMECPSCYPAIHFKTAMNSFIEDIWRTRQLTRPIT
ncbi:hypothetical protein COLO4_10467 [Corchorus olitorius]|uniref:Uncharacterized protein n=1 Tax=Corchorus olitorius TaxID=93759 RepID=A0A1R3K8L2_9ROSI|nr:hypothetical protein COLO4_10467 [Corchorus olitorius]